MEHKLFSKSLNSLGYLILSNTFNPLRPTNIWPSSSSMVDTNDSALPVIWSGNGATGHQRGSEATRGRSAIRSGKLDGRWTVRVIRVLKSDGERQRVVQMRGNITTKAERETEFSCLGNMLKDSWMMQDQSSVPFGTCFIKQAEPLDQLCRAKTLVLVLYEGHAHKTAFSC